MTIAFYNVNNVVFYYIYFFIIWKLNLIDREIKK